MSVFDDALQRVLVAEGGYVSDPADRGGETAFGITRAVAREHGYTGPMATLPVETAQAIYRTAYWDAIRLDEVADWHPPLAILLFDIAVNMGTGTAVRFLQRALNLLNRNQAQFPDVSVDGKMGTQTLNSLRQLPERDKPILVRLVGAYQARRYIEIIEQDPSQERFTRGWIARLGSSI